MIPTPASPAYQSWKIDPVLLLLFSGVLAFTGLLIWVAKAFPNDGQTFQVISGLLTGFAGSFFTRLNPRSPSSDDQTKSTLHAQGSGATVSITEEKKP